MGYLKIFHKFILSFQWHSECIFASECLSLVVIYHLSKHFTVRYTCKGELQTFTADSKLVLGFKFVHTRSKSVFLWCLWRVYIPCVGHDTSYYQNLWKCTEVFWYSFPFRASTEFYSLFFCSIVFGSGEYIIIDHFHLNCVQLEVHGYVHWRIWLPAPPPLQAIYTDSMLLWVMGTIFVSLSIEGLCFSSVGCE